jgi:uncharacterized RDD family membrane protein YckC
MTRIEPTIGKLAVEDTYASDQAISDNVAVNTHNPHSNLNKQLATVGSRYLGQIIDGIITALIFVVCLFITKEVAVSNEIRDLIVIVIPSLYFLLSDGLPQGQSLGKKILKISVVNKSTGESCSVLKSFIRNVLTPFIGFIDAIFILTKKKRRLGDYMANTIVIKNS